MSDTPAERVDREIGWAVRRYVQAVAAGAPLVVIIDDLQWAEAPVVAIAEQLAERLTDVPLLIICMARPEFLETHGGWSAGKPNAAIITLDPLNAKETGTLISHLLEIEALPDALKKQIVERSGGTPLFCEEFIHMLIDEGIVVREGDHWRALDSIDQIRVPQGINAVLAARLDLLPEQERTVLQSASVIGQRFGLDEVAVLSGADVETDLESLHRKGLVGGSDRPDEEYWFRHILIRDAAYASLPKVARASLHDRFRAALEREAKDPQQICEILAHHAERAFSLSHELNLEVALVGERARHAIDWLFALADRARTHSDVPTFESTLALLRTAADTLADDVNPAVRARLRLLEAQLLLAKGEYSSAGDTAAEAAALAEQANLPQLVATSRLAEAWIATWAGANQSLDVFRGLVDRAIEACQRAGDVPGEIEAHHILTNALWSLGQIDEYVTVNEGLIRQAREIGDIPHVAAITSLLTRAEFARGNYEASERHGAQAESLALEYGLRNVALRVEFDRAFRELWCGDLAGAEGRFRRFLQAAIDAGARQHELSALRFLGNTLICAGKPQEAAEVLDRALDLSRSTGERWNRTEVLALRARAALDLGDLAAADRFIRESMDSLRGDDLTAAAEANTQLGAIRAAQGQDTEAEAALNRGIAAVASTHFVHIAVPAVLELAIFLASRGRGQEAKILVDQYMPLIESRQFHAWDRYLEQYRRLDKTERLV